MKRGIKVLIGLALILAAPSVAVAARSSIDWVNLSGTVYIQPNFPSGMDLLIYGSNHYINFGTVTSSSGYGFRDNGGTMEFKNSGGSWTGIGTGVGGGGGTDGNWVFFNNSGIKLATTTNQVVIGETATTTTSTVEVNGDITVKGGIVATASSTFVSTTTQFGILMPVGALMVGLNTATTSGGAISLAKAFSAIGNANPNVGTSSGLMIYNTTDQSTNYERGELGWDNNIFRIRVVQNGGGTARQISLGTKSRAFVIDESGATAGFFYSYTNSTGSTASAVGIKTTRTNTSANAVELGIAPTYNNSSTAGYAALQIKPTETTLGSGTNYLAEMGTSTNADLFTVDNAGNASTTKLFGAMLATCNSASSALTWSAGTFGCNSITGGSTVWPFVTTDTNFGVAVQSTTTPLWLKNGFMSSSTANLATTSIPSPYVLLLGTATTSKQSVGGAGPENIGIQRAAANNAIIYSGVTNDIQARWLVQANGLMGFGAGGASDQDINFGRFGAGGLYVQSATTDSTDAFTVRKASAGTGTKIFGVNTTSSYSETTQLLVNGAGGGAKVDVFGNGTTAFRAQANAASDVGMSSFVTGDAQLRFSFLADGTLKWGPGTAVADANLYRVSTSTIKTDNSLVVGSVFTLSATTSSLLATDSSGNVIATSSVGANYITGTLGTINTTAPLGGGAALTRGGTLTLTCSTCIAWPWTVATNFATSTQSTTTPAWFKLGMMASSTSQFDNSSTTLATIFNTLYVGAGTGAGTSTASFAGGVNKTWVMGSYGSTQTGNGSFFIASSTSAGSILSNQYFMIDQSGNVGIGTTTPIGRIHISAGANATSTATLGELGLSTSKACVNLQTSAGTAGFLYLNGAGTVVSGLGSC